MVYCGNMHTIFKRKGSTALQGKPWGMTTHRRVACQDTGQCVDILVHLIEVIRLLSKLHESHRVRRA